MAKALKPASTSPNKIQLRSLFMFPSFFCAIPLPRPDTLGTEKKSGVPYILMSQGRHRQTPLCKHDQKTRHVGLAHVAQLRISLAFFTLAKFSLKRQYAVAYVLGAFRASPAPRRGADGDGTPSLPFGHARCVAGNPRLCPLPWEARGDADGDGTPSLPQEATRVSLPRMAAMERGPPVVVATSCDPPVVSGRWRVLGAALRRAIASRRAVPADVKDQLSRPCRVSWQ